MKDLSFQYESSDVKTDELFLYGEKLKLEISHIAQKIKNFSDSQYDFINVPFDNELPKKVKNLVDKKKQLKPTILVVIGIGGSNLGIWAIQEALYGKFYNEQLPALKIYFADTIDSDYIYDIVLLVEQELEKNNEVLINVISKSGTTTETVANFELFFHLLKKARAYANKCMVATTDKDSALWQWAQKHQIDTIEIPKEVGGRYSVFSSVGLFPLAMLDIDIASLLKGARDIIPLCLREDILNNPAACSASIIFHHYTKGKNIHDLFLFSVDLENIGKWYRQLVGESLGKENETKNKVGVTPTVSIGTIDLHSVGQLYLGGPADKITTFISVSKNKSNIIVPYDTEFENLAVNLQKKSFNQLMQAVFQGVKKGYQQQHHPFMVIELPEKSAYYCGQLLQFFMMQVVYLGYLLEVNPFDQPHVELYKNETKKILSAISAS